MEAMMKTLALAILLGAATLAVGCAHGHGYHDDRMDFGGIRTVAVLPFTNLSRDNHAAERVRDVFSNKLLATGAVYVLPSGDVARGIARSNLSGWIGSEEVVKLGKLIKADAVITGVIREYGELRSGSSQGNAISLSVQMLETDTGRVVWTASTTRGGVGARERLLGGGGKPMNAVTEIAVDDLLKNLFR
jgi:polysaccharide biosynthesis protein PelC